MKFIKLILNKLIIQLAFLIIFPSFFYAQTLVFKQVLLVSTSQTVPANHVWKIESVMPIGNIVASVPSGATNNNATTVISSESIILVNGGTVAVTSSKASQSNGYNYPTNNTIAVESMLTGSMWLPAGTTLEASTNVRYISVIEFLVQ